MSAHAAHGVLIVSNGTQVLQVTKVCLERLGAAPIVAADGIDALAKFEASPHSFAAVVLDLAPSGVAGVDLLVALRQLRARIPVLAVTGPGTKRERPLEGVPALRKPLDREKVQLVLQRLLGTAP